MKSLVLSSFVLALAVVSCSGSEEKKIISIEKKKMYAPATPVHANRKLTVEVSGMSCEHACGGSIRMALKETNAVDRVSFDFEADRPVNTAFITFDKSKINADQIIAIIQDLNNKQFTTGKVSSSDLETSEPSGTNNSSTTEHTQKTKVSVSTATSFEFPNLFELFSRIIS